MLTFKLFYRKTSQFRNSYGYNLRGYNIDRGKFVVNVGCYMNLIYWSVRSSRRRGEDGVKGVDWGIVILASFGYQLLHENLVQHPSNKRSIEIGI